MSDRLMAGRARPGRPLLTPDLASRMGRIWGAWQVCRLRGLPVGPASILELAQRPIPPERGKPRIGSWHRDRLR